MIFISTGGTGLINFVPLFYNKIEVMKATAKWVEQLAFDVVSDNGHTIRMDTTAAGGSLDSGMSPKKAMLGALNVCSGMDVAGILKKMRVTFTKLEVESEAEQTDVDPKVFKSIQMKYRSDISKDDIEKFQKAIHLSHENYCGISAMLKKHCDITYEVELM